MRLDTKKSGFLIFGEIKIGFFGLGFLPLSLEHYAVFIYLISDILVIIILLLSVFDTQNVA